MNDSQRVWLRRSRRRRRYSPSRGPPDAAPNGNIAHQVAGARRPLPVGGAYIGAAKLASPFSRPSWALDGTPREEFSREEHSGNESTTSGLVLFSLCARAERTLRGESLRTRLVDFESVRRANSCPARRGAECLREQKISRSRLIFALAPPRPPPPPLVSRFCSRLSRAAARTA